jgi:hypothetical protein
MSGTRNKLRLLRALRLPKRSSTSTQIHGFIPFEVCLEMINRNATQYQGVSVAIIEAAYADCFELRVRAPLTTELSQDGKHVSGSNARSACGGIQPDPRPLFDHSLPQHSTSHGLHGTRYTSRHHTEHFGK